MQAQGALTVLPLTVISIYSDFMCSDRRQSFDSVAHESPVPQFQRNKEINMTPILLFALPVQIENLADVMLVKVKRHGGIRTQKAILDERLHPHPEPFFDRVGKSLLSGMHHSFGEPFFHSL